MLRIVSLLASATETVYALGLGSWLVGRSHECDHPPGVRELPRVSEPRFDIRLPSREIDRSVKDLLRESLGVYRVDAEELRRLSPDVILTQTQCEVCAVTPADLDEALREWIPDSPPTIVHLQPNTLQDILEDFRRVADALGHAARGEILVQDVRTRMRQMAARAETPAPDALPAMDDGGDADEGGDTGDGSDPGNRRHSETGSDGPDGSNGVADRPSVGYIEWVDPLMAGGNWMPELVSLAGGEPLFVGPGEHSPELSWTGVLEADPDVLFVSPCGYDLERARGELGLLEARQDWNGLRAVREGRVFVADANAFLTRPGPRVVESLRILCEVLHPERFPPILEGLGWAHASPAQPR